MAEGSTTRRVAIVTGASSGIGEAVALALLAQTAAIPDGLPASRIGRALSIASLLARAWGWKWAIPICTLSIWKWRLATS